MTLDLAALKRELIRDEGLRLKVYRCSAGKATIGVGRNLDDVGILSAETKALCITRRSAMIYGITREQAMALLDSDIERAIANLDRRMPWWRTLSPRRQRVLINMTFNLGTSGVLTFKNALRSMREGDYEAAARGMQSSLWYRQVGDRAKRLVAMMREG